MIPLFQEFRLQVRVRDQFYKVIFSYDPTVRNPHNNVLYCLADGNHIYTLNHNLKRLQQMKENETYFLYVSSDYRTHHDEEPDVYHYMIDSVNDVIKILKSEEAVEKQTLYLVHREDDLVGLLYEMLPYYKPLIKFEAGKITHLIFEGKNQSPKIQII